MPHTHVELSQTGYQGVPHDDHEHLTMHNLHENLPTDKSHYLLATIGEISVGEPVNALYHGPTVAYVIEGEIHIKDKSTPDKDTKLVTGDVIHIDEGTYLTITSPNKARLFAASYSPSHLHHGDYVLKK